MEKFGWSEREVGYSLGFLGLMIALVQGGLIRKVSAPVLGNLSDRYGRRPVLLFSLMAFSADYLVMGLAPTLTWLFFGRIMAGIAGATFTPANAYIADVSPPEKRAQNFGLIGAAFGLGFIIGPFVFGQSFREDEEAIDHVQHCQSCGCKERHPGA